MSPTVIGNLLETPLPPREFTFWLGLQTTTIVSSRTPAKSTVGQLDSKTNPPKNLSWALNWTIQHHQGRRMPPDEVIDCQTRQTDRKMDQETPLSGTRRLNNFDHMRLSPLQFRDYKNYALSDPEIFRNTKTGSELRRYRGGVKSRSRVVFVLGRPENVSAEISAFWWSSVSCWGHWWSRSSVAPCWVHFRCLWIDPCKGLWGCLLLLLYGAGWVCAGYGGLLLPCRTGCPLGWKKSCSVWSR